ncbi:MAG: DinB family protein [Flavobacterium sp.]|nr:MAG: DinB family protein [Flavobacterium sp.]
MKVKSEALLSELVQKTQESINFVETLKTKSDHELNWRSSATSWSILECLEHLNLYGDFYLPEIDSVIQKANSKSEPVFKSGFLGNYFASTMLPKEKLNKMKTFKDKNPLNCNLSRNTIDRYIKQQKKMADLLHQARNISLNKEKTKISITKWIRLKIGDTFRFVINHNLRHLNQIEKIMNLQLQTKTSV